MQKLLYITPLAFALILSSCGSKEAADEKKEEGKKAETACDCMQILLDEMKKTDDPMKMKEVQEELDKQYPECEKLVTEMKSKYGSADEAAADCPAVGELMNLLNPPMEEESEMGVEETGEEEAVEEAEEN